MRSRVVPELAHYAVHRNDVIVARDDVRQSNLIIATLDEDGVRKHCNPVGIDMIGSGSQPDNIKPAHAKLPHLTFTVTLLWGYNCPPGVGTGPWESLEPLAGARGGVAHKGGWT